jgi:hypothetical protein
LQLYQCAAAEVVEILEELIVVHAGEQEIAQSVHIYLPVCDTNYLMLVPYGVQIFPDGLGDVMDRTDSRVIQSRSSPGFLDKPLFGMSILCQFCREEFQHHVAFEPEVFGSADHPHSPTAKILEDPIM